MSDAWDDADLEPGTEPEIELDEDDLELTLDDDVWGSDEDDGDI